MTTLSIDPEINAAAQYALKVIRREKRQMRKPVEPRADRTLAGPSFITSLHKAGWRSINSWENAGHVFELLGRNGKTVIVQIYPEGCGFEVWRPVSVSGSIAETAVAVEEYGR